MQISKVHCFFEQSGTFKNEFKKLGIDAEDYDILNDFNETDNVVDLFAEIEKAYGGGCSLFDKIKDNEQIIAFFPCVRFEDQIQMGFRGIMFQQKNKNDIEKLEYDLKLHSELHLFYEIITKLAIICLKRKIPLIVENPYSTQHYLTKYWAIKSRVIDLDRTKRGDFFVKPTQYWFIGCEPKNNLIMEAQVIKPIKSIVNTHNKAERSLISKEYANRFIREFII